MYGIVLGCILLFSFLWRIISSSSCFFLYCTTLQFIALHCIVTVDLKWGFFDYIGIPVNRLACCSRTNWCSPVGITTLPESECTTTWPYLAIAYLVLWTSKCCLIEGTRCTQIDYSSSSTVSCSYISQLVLQSTNTPDKILLTDSCIHHATKDSQRHR